ncbi:MAG: site-2 protease family protein [Bacillota bacterium]
MYIMKLWGIKFKLNFLFLVVILIFGYFRLLDKALVTFGAALLHELMHVLVARHHNIEIAEVELLPFGGVAKYADLLELEPDIEIKTALAGPLLNLLLAGMMAVSLRYSLFTVDWGLFFIKTNLIIACFNLLPALPLDGGRVFRAIETKQVGFREATKLSIKVSKYLAVIIGIGAAIGLVLGRANIMLLIISFFIYVSTGRENRNNIYVLMKYLTQKKHKLRAKKIMMNEELVVIESTQLLEITERFKPNSFHTIVILDDDLNLITTLTEEEIITGLLSLGINGRIKDII